MSALLAFFGILCLYTLVEDILWALKAQRPMARPLTRRELKARYRARL